MEISGDSVDPLIERLNSHALLVGQIAMGWAHMHEVMATTFGYLFGRDGAQAAWAAWHSIKSDRQQREALMAAANAVLKPEDERLQALKWAVDQMDSLENKRNDAVHAPFSLVLDEGMVKVMPLHFTGNKRAQNLNSKADLALELESYRDNIKRLSHYLVEVQLAMVSLEGPHRKLPERPSLPRPAQAGNRGHQSKA